jgi:hypothetical protein
VSARLKRLIAIAVTLVPADIVLACPVCGADKDDRARQAFFDTTIFLSLLPLAMFGGVVYWFVRRARAAEVETRSLPSHDDGGRAA